MSVNSASLSSSSNDSILHSNLSSTNVVFPFDVCCLITGPSLFIFTTFCVTNIFFLLPLCILVLYLGLQRWRQQRSTSIAVTTNHSDSFTYHMVTMELIAVTVFFACSCGMNMGNADSISVWFYLWSFIWCGQTFFHNLTCVERYLAAAHPIIYLGLKGERGVRIKNISIGCVWLLSFGGTSLTMTSDVYYIVCFCLLIFSLIVMMFCSISVLCILIRPGPGEQGGGRQQVDKSKKRAFYTILAILGVLLIRCIWDLFWLILRLSGYVMDGWGKWRVICLAALDVEDVEDVYMFTFMTIGTIALGFGIFMQYWKMRKIATEQTSARADNANTRSAVVGIRSDISTIRDFVIQMRVDVATNREDMAKLAAIKAAEETDE